jgi:hypothetical protein
MARSVGERTLRFSTFQIITSRKQRGAETIDKSTLFETTKALWPVTVRVVDNSDATNEIYRTNEKAIPQDENWRQLALWSFHQALGAHEKWSLAKGVPLHPHDVAFDEFDMWMRANLSGDNCWLDERAEYESI